MQSPPSPRHRRPQADMPLPPPENDVVIRPRRYRPRPRRRRSFWERIPSFLRVLLSGLLIVLIVALSAAITRNYMAAQEERRRLEAEAAERAQHPLYFRDFILQYAAEQSLDPALVSAIILNESSFNPQAVSYLGARGLMQIMEDTAGWIAHKLDEDDSSYSFDLLFDPETNIRFGTWYLGYLSRRFDGDPVKIVCAYHAGQGNVDAWLSKPAYSRDGVTLDVIPMEDTATYASRILNARDVYHKYYFQPASTSDSAESH